MFNPQGKRTWRKPPSSLWGLPLLESWESKQAEPLNPNLLFAGQYFDQESGLAYNRFRYYDPQSGCYLKSDPIGLAGGETPYGYVHNPWDWLDPFGLAKCPVNKYEVGTFKDLKNRSVSGDNLDIHHVVQTQPGKQVIPSYNRDLAPAIALPSKEHKLIPTMKGNYSGSPRDILAKDIRDLRKYTNAPNSALKELIELNKKMYPSDFIK